MNISEMIEYTIKLVGAAISDTVPPLPPKDLDWNHVFLFATAHKLVSMINFAILKFPKDVQDSISVRDRFTAAWKQELFFDANRQADAQTVGRALDDIGVDYVFLKGYVTKHIYPDTAMRSMGDMDILYRTSAPSSNTPTDSDLANLMKELGYEHINHTPKDDAFFNRLNSTCIELHRTLVDKGYETEYAYLEDIWEKLEKKSDHEYIMRPEDFYIYHIIHMAKHIRHSGIGLIQFVDLWLFINHHKDLDADYLQREFSTLQLDKFEFYARMLARKWFDCGNTTSELSDADNKVLDLFSDYIFKSGSYGNVVQMEINTIATTSENGTSGALLRRVFPDKKTMVNYYGEIIEKHPWLIPFYWIYLNICRLFSKERSLKDKKRIISKITSEQVDDTKYLLDKLFK